MTREEMQEFVEMLVARTGVPHATALLEEERSATVRFGRNSITQNMDIFRRTLRLTVGDGTRKASLTTHRIDRQAMPEIAAEAAALLGNSSPDPEYMPPVDPGMVYPEIPAWDDETAIADPASRMAAASMAASAAAAADAEAAGITGVQVDRVALATSTGNVCYHQSTSATFQLTVHAGEGSSYRATTGTAWRDLPVERSVAEVVDEALLDSDQGDCPAGVMDVVLEPQAVADLLPYILFSLNARNADEGLTVFTGMEGRRVASEMFTLSSELRGPVPGRPFDPEGLPSEDTVWIGEGSLRNMLCDRFWAGRTGRRPLSSPGCFSLAGGAGTADELAARSGRCLRIRRLWYIRFVDQKSFELTGMTRDGVFLVEDGGRRPVRDFRWNWKPLDLFSRIVALGTPERKGGMAFVPPVLLADVKV